MAVSSHVTVSETLGETDTTQTSEGEEEELEDFSGTLSSTSTGSCSVIPASSESSDASGSRVTSLLTKAVDVKLRSDEVLSWWQKNSEDLPFWSAAACKVVSSKLNSIAKCCRSSVWNHFEKHDDPEYAVCLVNGCKAKIKQSCGNTSNLLKHLKTRHIKEHQECLDDMKANAEKRGRKHKDDGQQTLPQSLERSTAYPKDSTKRKIIDDAMLKMIVTDLQPLSVEDGGLNNLVSILDSLYQLPSRATITRRLPELYAKVKAKLYKQLEATSNVSLTTDIWTSRQTKSYCCITAHYITANWELKSSLLETFEFNTEHTAAHIAAELHRVATAWNISNKIACITTDNASNMTAAIREMGWRHLPCFAHSLNLVVQDAMKLEQDLKGIKERCDAEKELITDLRVELIRPPKKDTVINMLSEVSKEFTVGNAGGLERCTCIHISETAEDTAVIAMAKNWKSHLN
uniref:BED-type domain-containing protein n=1 Tax=Amphimedon queenslandica TaxID=400682 RepID=A0A1X7VJ64_AMPQE